MTIRSNLFKKLIGIPLAVAMTLQGGWFIPAAVAQTVPTLVISNNPFLNGSGGDNPNVLFIMDNSNSMDEAADGHAVGSDSPDSKSEIARNAAKNIISAYSAQMNIGLMAYQQNNITRVNLYNSLYDASFDPAKYDPTWDLTVIGARASPTHKRYYLDSPWVTGNRIYYNIALPMYDGTYVTNPQPTVDWSTDPRVNAATLAQGNPLSVRPAGFWNSTGAVPCIHAAEPGYTSYSSKTDTSDSTPGNGANGIPRQYCPSDSDLAQGFRIFGYWLVNIPARTALSPTAPTWFNNNTNLSVSKGFLHVPIAPVDATQLNALNTKLGTSQFTTNAPTNPAFPLQNAGNTPMAGTLETANTYFNSGLSAGNLSAVNAPKPATGTCTNNYAVFLTDGLPATSKGGTEIASPAAGLAEVVTEATSLRSSAAKVKTYMVGFAMPTGTDPAQLNAIAAAGGTGAALMADDTAALNAALDAIFASIMADSSSYAAVAANSSQLTTSSVAYQAKLKTTDWSGDLLAWKLDPSTGATNGQLWSAAGAMPSGVRNAIYTYKPSTKKGIKFTGNWAVGPNGLDSDQQSKLAATPAGVANLGGEKMLAYIAGDTSKEGHGPGDYRARASKLGDIVNGAPVYVGKPQSGYPDTIQSGSSYSAWAASQASRSPMVYVGANDGMLHGLDAATGVEKFAYVPSAVYGNLPFLASQHYDVNHRFFVDGQPVVGDAYIKANGTGGTSWRTVLAGGLNAGGQGIYALDITNPSVLNQNSVLWEFTDRDDADMGYTFSVPAIAKARNGKWVAIFGNGYNNTEPDGAASASGNAVLYVVDLETGALIKKLDTGRGYTAVTPQMPNGLSTPAAADVDGDGYVEFVYAGDLHGNLWKFDLMDSNPANWVVSNGQPLFTARDSSNKMQQITTRPEVSFHPNGGYMVYFGTGEAFQNDSIRKGALPGAPTNTFYGIWDKGQAGTAITGGRSALQQQRITDEVASVFGGFWRAVTNNPTPTGKVDWTSKRGWYIDLVSPASTPPTGERVIGNPVFDGGRIIFVSVIPSVDGGDCTASGVSWLMDLDAYSGGRLGTSPFDVNSDGHFDTIDIVTGTGGQQPPGGVQITGLTSSPNIQRTNDPGKNVKIMNSSTGTTTSLAESAAQGNRRQSWRDVLAP